MCTCTSRLRETQLSLINHESQSPLVRAIYILSEERGDVEKQHCTEEAASKLN